MVTLQMNEGQNVNSGQPAPTAHSRSLQETAEALGKDGRGLSSSTPIPHFPVPGKHISSFVGRLPVKIGAGC